MSMWKRIAVGALASNTSSTSFDCASLGITTDGALLFVVDTLAGTNTWEFAGAQDGSTFIGVQVADGTILNGQTAAADQTWVIRGHYPQFRATMSGYSSGIRTFNLVAPKVFDSGVG